MEQQANAAAIKVGDYVKRLGEYALVIGFDDDGDLEVINEGGDNVEWFKNSAVVVPQEEANANLAILGMTEDYNAVIDYENSVVKVGCQRIPFAKVLEIAALCK